MDDPRLPARLGHARRDALGVNQIAARAGQFLGLVAGGLLAEIDWRAVFWVSVPFGLFGTVWSIRSRREVRAPRRARIDWGGNITFAAGTGSLLAAITCGIQPHGGSPTGWGNPVVLGGLAAGVLLLVAFCVIETRVADPTLTCRCSASVPSARATSPHC